jgi:hypothetical protein
MEWIYLFTLMIAIISLYITFKYVDNYQKLEEKIDLLYIKINK